MQVGEKAARNYRHRGDQPRRPQLERRCRDNAIYELADALVKLRAYEFPLQLSDTTRAYFARRRRRRAATRSARR